MTIVDFLREAEQNVLFKDYISQVAAYYTLMIRMKLGVSDMLIGLHFHRIHGGSNF